MIAKYTAEPREIRRVTSVDMFQRFNEGGYWAKVKSGELTAYVLESRRSYTLANETLDIESQMVSYRNEAGEEVARVHQF